MRQTIGVLVVCGLLAAPVAHGAPATTDVATIQATQDNRLEHGPGDAHLTRQELAQKTSAVKPVSLAHFGQLTDKHVIDEESPLRVEFTDKYGLIFTSAYRPQEGMSAHVVEEMVKQLRNTRSPISGKPIEFVMTTGDNTDNSQCNETRWMIDLLDGGTTVDPDSGVDAGTTFTRREVCLPDTHPTAPAPAPECGPGLDGPYDGVRGDAQYWEPDFNSPPGPQSEDGNGYSEFEQENVAEVARRVQVRDHPGILEAMNEPFRATGLGIPWYGIFGNHDGLLQGNQPRNPGFEALGVSCAKVIGLTEEDRAAVEDAPTRAQAMANALAGMRAAAESGAPELVRSIPADPRRRPLRKNEYIAEHFRTGGQPAGHGFTAANVASGSGHYSIQPRPSLRFIVLDSVAEHGLEDGNLDDAQFRWLHDEITQARGLNQGVVVFAHHSLRSMGQPPVSPFLPGDTGGNLMPDVHFGVGPRNTGIHLPCATDNAALPPYPGETLKCLLLRHRNVVAFVNGHEHANRVDPFARPGGGGFWEINTASHIDWPQQSRTIDIVDNRDGTWSLWGTLVDHGAATRPGEGEGFSVSRLASISRELSHNDHQGSTGEDQQGDARGSEEDRNVELVVRDPRSAPAPSPPAGALP